MAEYKAMRNPKNSEWRIWYMHTKDLGHLAEENGFVISFRRKRDAKNKAKAMNRKMAEEGGAA